MNERMFFQYSFIHSFIHSFTHSFIMIDKTSIRPILTFEKEAESEFEKFQNDLLIKIGMTSPYKS
jgi:hypothetical protein